MVQFSRKKGSLDDLCRLDRTVVAQILGVVMSSVSQFSKDGILERYAEEIIRERGGIFALNGVARLSCRSCVPRK